MYVCTCVCSPTERPVEGTRSPRVGVSGCKELCPTSAGSRTQVHFTSPRRDLDFFTLRIQVCVRNPDGQSGTGAHSNNFTRPWGMSL